MISSVALSCGGTALAQTNNGTVAAAVNNSTNGVAVAVRPTSRNLGNVTVVGKLDQARSQILPNLGATAYTHTADQIEYAVAGRNAPIEPGHPALAGRGAGFGGERRFARPRRARESAISHQRRAAAGRHHRVSAWNLTRASLSPCNSSPARCRRNTVSARRASWTSRPKAARLKTAATVEMYGGSYDTISPSFEYGGSQGKWNYFVDGSYDHNDLGIENPTSSHDAIHDDTDQYKAFVYASHPDRRHEPRDRHGQRVLRNFQMPNTPGLPAAVAPDGNPWNSPAAGCRNTFNSADLNENQIEQNYYGVVAYQKSAGDLNYQVSALWPRQRACISRPDIRPATFISTAWPARWNATSIPADCRPTPATNSATSTRFAAA